jgi:hypothetical protein
LFVYFLTGPKLIAVILCTRMLLPEDLDLSRDPVGNMVDLYERILAELLTRRRHGRMGGPPRG